MSASREQGPRPSRSSRVFAVLLVASVALPAGVVAHIFTGGIVLMPFVALCLVLLVVAFQYLLSKLPVLSAGLVAGAFQYLVWERRERRERRARRAGRHGSAAGSAGSRSPAPPLPLW